MPSTPKPRSKRSRTVVKSDNLRVKRHSPARPVVKKSKAQPDAEPSAEAMKAEESNKEESLRELKKAMRGPSAGEDITAAYMHQLGSIPLFTPEQEIENARLLEEYEIEAWTLLLSAPRAVVHLQNEAGECEEEDISAIDKLLTSYRRSASKSKARKLKATPQRSKLIKDLAPRLRRFDSDNELLDSVLGRLRREVWRRRVLSDAPSFRMTQAQLSDIENERERAHQIRNKFVRSNLRLVVSVARKFGRYDIPIIDLIQEGNMGLMKAVHRFDHARGFRFSTYAHWWIRQSIERAIINKGSQVRLPVHVIEARRQINRAKAKLTQELERTPSVEEIAAQADLPVAKVEQVLRAPPQDAVSLDESVGGDDPRTFVDLVRDDSRPAIDEAVMRENTHSKVKELLSLLNPIEMDIIRRRFGIGDDTDQTLDEIGKAYNLSRERVRQIQAQGLAKMRRMCDRRNITNLS